MFREKLAVNIAWNFPIFFSWVTAIIAPEFKELEPL
jgi:hypothetical protein